MSQKRRGGGLERRGLITKIDLQTEDFLERGRELIERGGELNRAFTVSSFFKKGFSLL